MSRLFVSGHGFDGLRGFGGEEAFEDGGDFVLIYGLGDVVVHARFDTAFAISLNGIGGHGDDGEVTSRRFGTAKRGSLEKRRVKPTRWLLLCFDVL
jgi:hypothetical protein